MTKPDFRRDAIQLPVWFPGQFTGFAARPREFPGGDLGWSAAGQAFFTIGDRQMRCRVSIRIIVEGSKYWEE